MRNAQSYAPKSQQSMVAAALRQAFIQTDHASASHTLRPVADQLRPKWPGLAAFIDESEADVLAHMTFPPQHYSRILSTNPIPADLLDRLTSDQNTPDGSSRSSPLPAS